VLCVIPQVAEKRSRLLVPMFLEWTRATSCEDVEDDDEQELPDFHAQPKWSHKNSAEMLTLFSKFINPRVLYKADAVYSALLKLLASGDGKIQSLALNCILTWKMPAIKGYEDQLTNLLDDTRFRDELTNFVQLGEDESSIQANHRALLMPVLLRILYGRSLSRKRASSGKKGMSSTRTAILSSLTNFQPEDRALFIDVALAEISEVEFVDKHDPNEFQFQMDALGSIHFSLRKQVGLVRMFEDLFKQLGTSLLVNMPKMLDALLYCMVSSIKAIDAENKVSEADDTVTLKALKAIRQGGFK
jgi:U3 small nucleolar RNA-associated protein 20